MNVFVQSVIIIIRANNRSQKKPFLSYHVHSALHWPFMLLGRRKMRKAEGQELAFTACGLVPNRALVR